MIIGYMRVSKGDGSQILDLQRDAILKAGVDPDRIYQDFASGKKDDRPGLVACLKAVRKGDTLVVWSLDRLGRSLGHLISTVDDLTRREIAFKVLNGVPIDTATAQGRLMLGVFATLAEFERELIRERTRAGLVAARARGRFGGRPPAMTRAKIRLAQATMRERHASPSELNTSLDDLCKELGIGQSTIYKYVSPKGELREIGRKVMGL